MRSVKLAPVPVRKESNRNPEQLNPELINH